MENIILLENNLEIPLDNSFQDKKNCKKDKKDKKDKLISKIKFNTIYNGVSNHIIIEKEKLEKWRNVSEFIDVLLNSYHENEILELDLSEIVDMYSLIIIFNFFDTEKILNIESEYKNKILNGLAYFGINSDILNSIKKGFGLVWKLTPLDNEIKTKENELKCKLQNFSGIELKNMDNDIILNKQTYNLLYEHFHENVPNIQKLYGILSQSQIIHPEFDLSFIKQEFEKNSNHIFDDISDCIVTGGMVSKMFTYTSYFIDTDYDVFLLTDNEYRALEIINTIYERLNSKSKTYILKTKNTITLYNNKYEVQIITKFYKNITEVFTNFDLDSCCVGYSNGKLYGLPRFIRSLAYSGNIFDPEKQSPSYIHRLKKYIKRGFTLYVPGLKKNDPDYNENNYIVKKLREKTDHSEKNSDYCEFFVFMKNRNNKEISELLKNYHKKGIFLDIFEIEDINNLNDKQIVNILWNNNYKKIFKDDFFKDMYNSIYIR